MLAWCLALSANWLCETFVPKGVQGSLRFMSTEPKEGTQLFIHGFWLSLGLIFLAELGDKTQLVALTYATRYRPKTVLAGITAATLLIHVFSAILGGLAGSLLPTAWIKLVAGIAFVGFGFWTLRGDTLDDEDTKRSKALSPFWIVFVTFFLAELGDKTMLSTVTLAATHPAIAVWLGSTLGMVISDGLAIWIGAVLGARLPERLVKVGATFVFFAFGVLTVWQSGLGAPYATWLTAAPCVAAAAVVSLRIIRSTHPSIGRHA